MQYVTLINTGKASYNQVWELQKHLFTQVLQNNGQHYLVLTEHDPVITIGKSGSLNNLLCDSTFLQRRGIELVENDRGGDITFHGPGQLVGYPILNLNLFKRDVHWYLRTLEEVIIQLLKEYDLKPERKKSLTGVWVNEKKICAIGIKTSRWITMHGFALNISTDLDYFKLIIPCGISEKGVTSISQLLGNTTDQNDVINKLIHHFAKIFKVNFATDYSFLRKYQFIKSE